ncbi:hypothetical protein EGR52_08780 [bacterium]|nr:hypothetical protein [bacterium]
MKLEEALIRLDEEELFGKVHSVDIEQSDVMKNLGTIANMINEAIENLKSRDRLLYEDVEEITEMQMECMKWLGDILGKIEKYM